MYKYKVRVPNYAQKTGKRLFLQPGFFEYGTDPRFTSSTREHDISFQFPWSEKDVIKIELPEGYKLDNAQSPPPQGDNQNISSLDINIGVNKETNTIYYERKFHFGGGGNVFFPVSTYSALKNMFDAFHKSNTSTLTLKKEAEVAE